MNCIPTLHNITARLSVLSLVLVTSGCRWLILKSVQDEILQTLKNREEIEH